MTWLTLLGCAADPDGAPTIPPPPIIERETLSWVAPAPQVDLLIVADTSSSIQLAGFPYPHLYSALADRLDHEGLDFRVATVVGTVYGEYLSDFGSDELPRWFEETTRLREPISPWDIGAVVGATEMGRDPVYNVLELHREHHYNRGLRREHAELHVLFVTDNIDQSVEIEVNPFLDWFATLTNPPAVGRLHAIALDPNHTDCTYKTRPSQYPDYAAATGGVVHSFCDPWEDIVDRLDLGLTAAGQRVPLPQDVPRDTPLQVSYATLEGETVSFEACTTRTDGCRAVVEDDEVVLLGRALPAGTQVDVTWYTRF